MSLKEFIENKMRINRLNQSEIARKIGISQSTINNILSGADNIREDVKIKIAVAFGLDPLYFTQSGIIAEASPKYSNLIVLTDRERKLLDSFRKLSEKRQKRYLEMIEDMVTILSGDSE